MTMPGTQGRIANGQPFVNGLLGGSKPSPGSSCGTVCMDPTHYRHCYLCGVSYHIGTIHTCPTAAATPLGWLPWRR